MILSGLSLAGDEQSARPTPTISSKIRSFKLMNGEYDELFVTKETDREFMCGDIPNEWDYNTLIWARFNGNLNTSNVGDDMLNAEFLRIKRRKKNTYNWITLFEVDPRTEPSGWQFTRYDCTAQSDQDYDYAIVPVAGSVEGNLNITTVYSCFNGIYIFEGGEEKLSFCSHAEYDNPISRNKPTTSLVTLGSQYPFTVSNGVANYDSGTFSGIFAPLVFGNIDLEDHARFRDEVLAFLTDGKVKLLKQDDGRIWLCQLASGVVDEEIFSRMIEHDISKISFDWVQIGDALKGHDLYMNDFIECDIDDISMY